MHIQYLGMLNSDFQEFFKKILFFLLLKMMKPLSFIEWSIGICNAVDQMVFLIKKKMVMDEPMIETRYNFRFYTHTVIGHETLFAFFSYSSRYFLRTECHGNI